MGIDIRTYVEIKKNGTWTLSDDDVYPNLCGRNFYNVLSCLGEVGVPDELMGVSLPDGIILTEEYCQGCYWGYRTVAPERLRDEYERARNQMPFLPHAIETIDFKMLQNKGNTVKNMLGSSEGLELYTVWERHPLDMKWARELLRMANELEKAKERQSAEDIKLFYFFDN